MRSIGRQRCRPLANEEWDWDAFPESESGERSGFRVIHVFRRARINEASVQREERAVGTRGSGVGHASGTQPLLVRNLSPRNTPAAAPAPVSSAEQNKTASPSPLFTLQTRRRQLAQSTECSRVIVDVQWTSKAAQKRMLRATRLDRSGNRVLRCADSE